MQPDYFAILRTLYEFRVAKQVGAKANSLLLALVWKANVMRWPDTLTIWNSEVRDLAGLSEEELVAARSRLTGLLINGHSLVSYQSGGTRKPGKYSLNYIGYMSFFKSVTPDITPENTVNVPGNPHSNVGGNPHSNVGGNDNFEFTLIPGGSKDDEGDSIINKTKRNKHTKQYTPDSPEHKLASYMLLKILHLNPNFKTPNMQNWAKWMDNIMRIDKRPYEEIKAVIDYIYAGWWRDKLLSPKKLREHYDRINMQRLKERRKEEAEVEWGYGYKPD